MLAMWLFFWPPYWGSAPPTVNNSLASRYRSGRRMNWVSSFIGFITWLITLL